MSLRTLALLAVVAHARPADHESKHTKTQAAHPADVHAKPVDEVAKKFHDLGKDTKAVAARWAKDPNMANHQLKKVPGHIKNRTRHSVAEVLSSIPVSSLGGCGSKLDVKNFGLKKSVKASKFWKLNGLLETKAKLRGGKAPEHPGRESFSVPGSGADQVMADNGMSTMGSVAGVEPFVTVLKDGFFEVGCYHDVMYKSADKYGDDKDQYKMGDVSNVSIAMYDELVLDEVKEEMKPIVCFEFCRTVPDMTYFGIANGRDCYCTPYFKPGPGGEKMCDSPCPGDPSTMCGNTEGKSSIYEMHLCDDIQTDLTEAMTGSKEALDYFFETAMLAQDLGKKMADSGKALQKAAGDSGAPGAGDNGQLAMQASKSLGQAFMVEKDAYMKLLTAYNAGKEVDGKEMTDSNNAKAAEAATRAMKASTGAVISGAAATHEEIKLAYPVVDSISFGDAPDGGDAAAMALQPLVDGEEQPEPDFRVASYAFDTTYVPAQSTCTGPVIGLPMMGLGKPGCARACEATVYPDLCIAYVFYTVTGADDLCFMLMDVNIVQTFTGPAVLLQNEKKASDPASAYCGIKMSQLSTGYKPKGDWKKTARSFGGDAGIALSEAIKEYSVPGGSELTLGAVKLEKAA